METNLGQYADCFAITTDPEVSKRSLFLQSVQYFHRHYQMALCTVQATWKEQFTDLAVTMVTPSSVQEFYTAAKMETGTLAFLLALEVCLLFFSVMLSRCRGAWIRLLNPLGSRYIIP